MKITWNAARSLAGSATLVASLCLAPAAVAGPGNDAMPEWPTRSDGERRGDLSPQDVPDIFGAGKVSTVGNMWMKTTNIGVLGNPFTALSSDPSAQWPGSSGIEHLFFVGLWIAAKDATVTDPSLLRRVSHNTEWRPASLAIEDRIYTTFDGQVGGNRFSDDDADGAIDEDRLDGHDNDNDGAIDEDYAAISQQMYSCILRDDTPQALEAAFAEKHVQRGLEVQQNTYTFSVPGANDFTSVEFIVENVSGHMLDSVYVGFVVDQDVGPLSEDRYFADDLAEPRIPQGPDLTVQMPFDDPNNPNRPYLETIGPNDPRFQGGLCTQDTIFVNGFTIIDDDGDQGETPSVSSFLLLGHTIDPTGAKAPRRTGFRMYSWFTPGVPFTQGGFPTNDLERYEILSSTRGIDRATGFINFPPPMESDAMDYFSLCSVGPFLNMAPGEKVTVSWALAAQEVDFFTPKSNLKQRYRNIIENAVAAQKTFDGTYEVRQGLPAPPEGPDGFGRETGLIAPPGEEFDASDCHDDSLGQSRKVRDDAFTWFDFDCNYCTGVAGHILKRWVASAPPPNPQMTAIPGDREVTIRWDNRSEYTPDPAKSFFDFKGYKIWKASNWTRPVGSTGPGDNLWALIGTFFWYDEQNPLIERAPDPNSPGDTVTIKTANVLLNRITGERIFPRDVPCVETSSGVCDTVFADKPARAVSGGDTLFTNFPVVKYPIGRYEFTDPNVLNGFVYFYSVAAFDSTGKGASVAKLEGRQAAVEAEGVVPQKSHAGISGGEIFVVPNPYKGRAEWDLTPNAADPTGTKIDFFNMPPGPWTLKIYTISGDLVQEIRSTDLQVNGKVQQETPEDGQASWNLVSRNGQEVVSGIYMFSVQSGAGTRQGKFVVIR